jgi:hypothetical protein
VTIGIARGALHKLRMNSKGKGGPLIAARLLDCDCWKITE